MSSETFWLALAMVLVIEGLFPFVSPDGWRKMFAQLLTLSVGQICFFGLFSIICGLAMIWWIAP